MQAIILAGGLGTRLQSVVSDKPKALSPVNNKPFLHYIIQYMQHEGVTDYIFALGYLAEQVVDFLKEAYPNLKYKYFIEEIPLGTGGGVRNAMELSSEEDVWIVNADTYFNVPLQQMFNVHKAANAACTISLKPMIDFDRYGSVEMDVNQNITSFREKKITKHGLVNGGYLIVNKNVYLSATAQLPEIFSFEKDFLEQNLNQMVVKGFVSTGYFIDIGIPEDFAKAQSVFSSILPIN